MCNNRHSEKMIFHKDIFMPKAISGLPSQEVQINCIGKHATNEIKNLENNFSISIPSDFISFDGSMVIEFEKNENSDKFVIRQSLSDLLDIIYVIRFLKTGKVLLVTCWINYKNDSHATLNKSVYCNKSCLMR